MATVGLLLLGLFMGVLLCGSMDNEWSLKMSIILGCILAFFVFSRI